MKNAFGTYHPVVNFVYFVFVLAFSMFLLHPVCLGISFGVSIFYFAVLQGKKRLLRNVCLWLPMILAAALINPAFNHQGITILTYLPSGNPLTMESMVYGVVVGVMLVLVMCWFSCFNQVMTSDKFIYLFGKITPSLSLILSMVLRFVPKFLEQMAVVANGQKCLGRDVSSGGILTRAKRGITILSSMVTWSLEEAIETADSMKSRGYGLEGRSAFSIYTWESRDTKAFLWIVLLGCTMLLGCAVGGVYFRYFPSIKGDDGILTGTLCLVYFCLCATPIFIERREAKKWQLTQSKI